MLKPGTVKGGTMMYALGDDDSIAPNEGWSTVVPTGNEAGKYHVWFKVDGDFLYNSIPPVYVPVTIAESRPPYRPRPDTSVKEYEEKVSVAKAKKVKIKSFKAKKNKKKTLKKLTAGKKTTKKTLMKLATKQKTYRIRIRSFTKVKNPTTGKT